MASLLSKSPHRSSSYLHSPKMDVTETRLQELEEALAEAKDALREEKLANESYKREYSRAIEMEKERCEAAKKLATMASKTSESAEVILAHT